MPRENPILGTPAADERLLFGFLSESDASAPSVCDAVIGFGVFDLRVAALCGHLAATGRARRIIFTGGIGAGSADLGRPEADAFADELARLHPDIPRDCVVIENRSTNTGENVRFTLETLAAHHPELAPGSTLNTALLVASPARLMRVRRTWQKHASSVACRGLAPESDCETESALHAAKGIDYRALLVGEIDRLLSYPARGWIVPGTVPEPVLAARARLTGQRT